jgi:hypothetical protein
MFLLMVYLQVVPPIRLGEFPTREACEQEIAALIAKVDVPATMRPQFVCLGPDSQVERKRLEYGPRP